MRLQPGTRLGYYEVLAPIGAGGMGEVYQARDTRLGRQVAIKVLPAGFTGDEDRLRRFEQEARSASSINHPNILTIHDVGTHDGSPYIVTELLTGETLREKLSVEPLSLEKAIDYAVQVGRGLAAAHEHGIVHRDLKPENLFVTGDGRVKILDFGLAKLFPSQLPEKSDPEAPTVVPTETGTVLGTVGYMSPEQVRGRAADARSDIFALGAILYEMVTGEKAFRGESPADRLSAVLKETPPGLAESDSRFPPALRRVIRRCLEKNPQERFQSAPDFAFALGEASGSPTPPPPIGRSVARGVRPLRAAGLVALIAVVLALFFSDIRDRLFRGAARGASASVAVLPLRNLSGDPEQEYLADGMTEALIAKLAEIGALRVISHTSVAQYKEAKKTLPEIGRELRVDTIVEGSVSRSGDMVQVTVQLISAPTDTHLWAKSYQRRLEDLLALQNEVARSIAQEIDVVLTPDERSRMTSPPPHDARTHEAYLKGRFFMEQGSEEGLTKAFEHWQRALQIEPNYAPAHAGIARYWSSLPFYSTISPAETFPKARSAALKAIELDDRLAEAHAALAYVRAYYEWDWEEAAREFQRALDLRPNSSDVHFSYSRFLAAQGRLDEAIAEIRRAQLLDPLSLLLRANTGLLFYFARRYDEALEQLQKIRQSDPGFAVAHWGAGLVYEQQRKTSEAIAAFEKAASLSKSANIRSSLAHAYARAGRVKDARAVLDELSERAKKSYVPSYFFTLIHLGLGEKDAALEWLHRAFQERSTVLAYLRVDPRLAPLAGDPRFEDLLRRIGIGRSGETTAK
ncbi:MAG: protein kinase [Thermoanaerobaculia bacterium]